MRTSISIRTAVANGMQLTLHVERQLSSVLKPDVVDDCMLHRLDVVLVSAGEESYVIGTCRVRMCRCEMWYSFALLARCAPTRTYDHPLQFGTSKG